MKKPVASGRSRGEESLRVFPPVRRGVFLERPNRFLVRCRVGRESVPAFLPNPGRLKELLLPGRRLFLIDEGGTPGRKTRFTVVAVERAGRPIVLHTHRTNDVARLLLERDRVPGLVGARILRSEVRVGGSRFDFLLEGADGEEILLEVKSCTLAGRKVAMFPDAVTARGTRHVTELAGLSETGRRTVILFVVQWPEAELFMPDFHTDPAFARALVDSRRRVETIAVTVRWDGRLRLLPEVRRLEIPWGTVEREAGDRGSYLLVLHLDRPRILSVGGLGRTLFPGGWYVYVGSAMKNLAKRIERHRRIRKRPHWHLDRFRPHARFVDALPVRSSERLECALAEAVGKVADWSIPGFGCSDCRCGSHLFGMEENPLEREAFYDLLGWFRMDRLVP